MSDTTSTSLTTAELLTQVNSAITAILVGGQSYKIGSRELTRADLSELKAWRDELETQADTDSNSRLMDNTYVAIFSGR